ncbi:MAG: Calx-beta domain-containing protein, partial [Maribacter sp.]
MQNSTSQLFFNKKLTMFSSLFFVLALIGISSEINAQGISSGVTFNWVDNQANLSDAATLDFIEIDGAIYNTFVVPSAYEMTRVGPGGHGGNHIWRNGTQLVGSSNASNWNTEATNAYQSINLNHYFESNSNGQNFCGDFGAAATTISQIQTITYSPGIPSNPDGILAVTERGGNNCQYLELYGIPVGGGAEQLLGRTFVRTSGNLTGVKPQAPPVGNSDYWSSGRNNDNGQIIGIGLFKLSDIAPVGSTITSIKYYAATVDNGDGKFFLMQTYAVDDIFDSEFDETFNGDVGANDNVPSGSSYSYFTSVLPLNGTVVVNTDGTFSYTPNPGFVGTDVFEVQVCLPAPNQSVCNTSTVTLTVNPDNLPTANDDSYTIEEDIPNNTFNVLNNDDFGLDGPQANVALGISTTPFNGTAAVNDNGTPSNPLDDYIVYTPNPYFNGTDSLVYQITDANGTIAYANVDITVNPDTTKNIDITTKNITVNENVGLATITVQIQGNYQVGPTISYRTIDNSAIGGQDYSAVSDNHTFAGNNGETFSFTIPITDDNIIELSEVLNIEVTSSSYTTPVNLLTDITIIDNDGGAGTGISFDNTNVTVNEDAGTATFNVVLAGNVAGGLTLDYATDNGSAMAPGDFVANTGQLTFVGNDGESHPITVSIVDDNIIEATENFLVDLSNLSTTLIAINTPQANGNIVDNDAGINDGISFVNTNVEVTEGVGVTATFEVALTGNFQDAFDISFETAFGTATDTDFDAQTGTISFTGTNGEVQTIVINILNDNITEPTEVYVLNLTGTTNPLVSINTPQANGSILDDDLMANDGISFV